MTEFEIAVLRRFGSRTKCEQFMNWSPSAVRKIVKGERQLKGPEIDKLAKEFNVKNYADFRRIFFTLPSADRQSG